MLPFGVTIPATVPPRSEIPEGLMNYPVEWEDTGGIHLAHDRDKRTAFFEQANEAYGSTKCGEFE
jgi:hypothetical protein